MKNIAIAFIMFFTLASTVLAATAPISVRLPDNKAWAGQRLPFFIELHAPGSFEGTASFDLPQLPGALLMKIGSPVVSSEEIDGQSWFVQTHEFALFSQKSGVLEVPEFPVRFASRTGFTGPADDVQAKFPGMKVEIKRPPGSEDIGFLITTESLQISETWTPEPGPIEAGAIFKRTIVQQAEKLSGMALAPAPTTAPDGINVYLEDAVTKDTIERGDFEGERIDTITYQLTQPGNFTLPELTYVWWNPSAEKLQRQVLPAVSFQVTLPPSSLLSQNGPLNNALWIGLGLVGVSCLIGAGWWQKNLLASWVRQAWLVLNPPSRVAARKLFHACLHHDARGALFAWNVWRNTQNPKTQFNSELLSAVLLLERHLFGPEIDSVWQGEALAKALRAQVRDMKAKTSNRAVSILPELN